MYPQNQREFIRQYNKENKHPFNNFLFERDEDSIILALKKIILSFQRSKTFTIRVDGFRVVDDYHEILEIMRNYEKSKRKSYNNSRSRDKELDDVVLIPIKDSAIKLLIVDYYLEVPNPIDPKYKSKNLQVIIQVPRIVNKYYFQLSGNLYSATYQIVDGSTYNNSNSNQAKSQSVAFKSIFMATHISRYIESIKFTNGETRKCIFYISNIFSKNVPVMRYLLAKMGIYILMDRLRIQGLYVSGEDPNEEDYYTVNKHGLYVNIHKYVYDNDHAAQSLLYTIYQAIENDTTVEDVYDRDFWLKNIGKFFGNESIEKGYNILDSLESIYDIPTYEALRLPVEHKKDIYCVLIWLIREFKSLRQKNNMDLSTKRIRYEEYFAALYAMKFSNNIIIITDEGDKIQLSRLEKCINIAPDYLIRQITKDKLVNYKNSVNDMDAYEVLKYTHKGLSGIGENTSSIPESFKLPHLSHLGRLDPYSTSSSDPGISGTICPLSDVHDNIFYDYAEPNEWRMETDKIISEYMRLSELKQAIRYNDKLKLELMIDEQTLDEKIDIFQKLLVPITYANEDIEYVHQESAIAKQAAESEYTLPLVHPIIYNR